MLGLGVATNMVSKYAANNNDHHRRPSDDAPTAGYDGGDCCACTCVPDGLFGCGGFGYACIDPEASCVGHEDETSPIVAL